MGVCFGRHALFIGLNAAAITCFGLGRVCPNHPCLLRHCSLSNLDMPLDIDDDEYVANLLAQDAKKTSKTYDLVGIDAFNPKRCVGSL